MTPVRNVETCQWECNGWHTDWGPEQQAEPQDWSWVPDDRPLTRWEMALTMSTYLVIAAAVALIVGVTMWGVWLIGDYVWQGVR